MEAAVLDDIRQLDGCCGLLLTPITNFLSDVQNRLWRSCRRRCAKVMAGRWHEALTS